MHGDLKILYEDNHLLVVNKPGGIATMGAAAGAPSIHALCQADIKRRYNKPGNVYLGVVSRLDAVVSGVLVLARTSKAAARLSAQFAAGSPDKVYWAIVESPSNQQRRGEPEAVHASKRQTRSANRSLAIAPSGTLEEWLLKNDQRHKMEIVHSSTPRAKLARLEWRRLQSTEGLSLLRIRLLTGRKHQIRVQLAGLGFPILGDVKYGAVQRRGRGIGLHAARLTIEHPTKNTPLELSAPPPGWWSTLGLDFTAFED